MSVLVLDSEKKPLYCLKEGGARVLLKQGKAAVLCRFPFTIILKKSVEQEALPETSALRLKIAPGAKVSGLVLLNDQTGEIAFACEIEHRGNTIKKALEDRRVIRRSRRNRHTRYRKPRFQNRKRREDWLPPSQESRLANILTWVARLRRRARITGVSLTHLKFDPAAMKEEYEQGSREGYEIQQYLLEKWGRQCAYCGKTEVPLTIDHIVPVSRGGRGNVSNLTVSCEPCNQAKGNKTLDEFLATRPELKKHILAQAKAPLQGVGQLNSTRWALFERIKALDLDFEVGTGGLMKYNRAQRHLPKSHWIDAACTGRSTPETLQIANVHPLQIKAVGHGTRQMCQTDKYGFPRAHRNRQKRYYGFRTGDIVQAIIPAGRSKYAGRYIARVTVRASGNFKLRVNGKDIPCHYRHCVSIHRADGYQYLTEGR